MGQCQFLRVQSANIQSLLGQELTHGCDQVSSSSIDYIPAAGNVWPYGSSGTGSASAISHLSSSMAAYPMGQGLSLAPMTAGSYTNSTHYPRTPSGQSYSYPAAGSRHAYASAYPLSYGDETADAYTQQSPPYMLPSQDTLGVNGVYGSQEALRTWNPISQSSKVPNNGIFLEQESAPSYGVPQFPCPSSSLPRHAAVTSDASSFFPAMTSLVSSLPVTGPTGNRTLPDPAAARAQAQQASVNTFIPGTNGEAVSQAAYASPQGTTYKSNVPWGPETVTSGGSHASTTSLSGPNMLMDSTSSKLSASAGQETAFGYIPLTGSPPADIQTPPMQYSTPKISNPGANTNYTSTSAVSSLPRTSSRDSLLQSHGSSSNLYSYSTESTSKRASFGDSTPSDGTLMSGQQYTRLRQHQSSQATSPDAYRRESFESRSHMAPRTSISSISNVHGY